MNIFFFGFVFFFFLILQTCILPCVSWMPLCFGVELVPVILVSILYGHYSLCICLALAGVLMDSLSGCAFFTHMFSYIWIYAMIQLFKRLVFLKNFLFIFLVALLSVCIEFAMIMFPFFIVRGQAPIVEFLLYWKQAVFAIIVIPPMVWIVEHARKQWVTFVKTAGKNWRQLYRD